MRKNIAIAALILALASLHCADNRHITESKVKAQYKNSRALNDTAAFLAGMPLVTSSALYPLSLNAEYKRYRASIDRIWEQYRKQNLANIEAWKKEHLRAPGSGTVFYPFSGPDILNALAFFPQAEEFIMIGLEQPGSVPAPVSYQGTDVCSELWKIKNALRTILQLNLFRTAEMKADFKTDSYSNITGITMFFIARYGYELLDIRTIYVSRNGSLAYAAPREEEKESEGVEFIFRKGEGSPVQRARFFSADLSDASLSRLRGFSSFVGTKKGFITFIKSASYLLSYDNFKIIRSYLLAGSRYLVQEDSGIPYRYFDRNEWKISFFGTYRVIAMFSGRFQRDLDAEMKKNSAGRIPFSFGYGFTPEKSNLMVAEKTIRK
jgi:hypothetical protein